MSSIREYYVKEGKRYRKVPSLVDGFPADGIWLVKRDTKKSSLVLKLSSKIEISNDLIKRTLMKSSIRDNVFDTLASADGISLYELADLIASNLLDEEPVFTRGK